MSILTDLATAAGGLLVIGGGVGLVVLFGRDPKADEHDLTDYHAPAASARLGVTWAQPPAAIRLPLEDILPAATPEDILPPAPPGMNAGSPLYAGMLFDTWHPEDPDVIAARWLREIAAEQHARAGIGPASEHWAQVDGSCWDDCPACARDLTGAFAVVRAA